METIRMIYPTAGACGFLSRGGTLRSPTADRPFGLILTRLPGTAYPGDARAISARQRAPDRSKRSPRCPACSTRQGRGRRPDREVLGPDTPSSAALGALVGHLCPVWLRSGRKGVATGLGSCSAVLAGRLLACLTWLAVAGIARYSRWSALVAFGPCPGLALAVRRSAKMEFSSWWRCGRGATRKHPPAVTARSPVWPAAGNDGTGRTAGAAEARAKRGGTGPRTYLQLMAHSGRGGSARRIPGMSARGGRRRAAQPPPRARGEAELAALEALAAWMVPRDPDYPEALAGDPDRRRRSPCWGRRPRRRAGGAGGQRNGSAVGTQIAPPRRRSRAAGLVVVSGMAGDRTAAP